MGPWNCDDRGRQGPPALVGVPVWGPRGSQCSGKFYLNSETTDSGLWAGSSLWPCEVWQELHNVEQAANVEK